MMSISKTYQNFVAEKLQYEFDVNVTIDKMCFSYLKMGEGEETSAISGVYNASGRALAHKKTTHGKNKIKWCRHWFCSSCCIKMETQTLDSANNL